MRDMCRTVVSYARIRVSRSNWWVCGRGKLSKKKTKTYVHDCLSVMKSFYEEQMLGYMRCVGSCGIHPFARPAEYDHSSPVPASVFHVHCIQPAPASYELVCASQNWRRNVLYWLLNPLAAPAQPSHAPTYVLPGYVPS